MDNISYLDIADTYRGPETEAPAVKAGTEELDFLSWTGTYNRDDESCADLSVSEEFLDGLGETLSIIYSKKGCADAG